MRDDLFYLNALGSNLVKVLVVGEWGSELKHCIYEPPIMDNRFKKKNSLDSQEVMREVKRACP